MKGFHHSFFFKMDGRGAIAPEWVQGLEPEHSGKCIIVCLTVSNAEYGQEISQTSKIFKELEERSSLVFVQAQGIVGRNGQLKSHSSFFSLTLTQRTLQAG